MDTVSLDLYVKFVWIVFVKDNAFAPGLKKEQLLKNRIHNEHLNRSIGGSLMKYDVELHYK